MRNAAILTLLETVVPAKSYGTSAVLAARHFHFVRAGAKALDLADALGREPEIEVVAVLGEGERPLGVVSRQHLFTLIGKPFGREVLARADVGEVLEDAPRIDVHASLFTVAASALDESRSTPYLVLVDDTEAYRGILSARDLSEYMSRITQEDIELAGEIQERLEECNEAVGDERFSLDAWSQAAKGVGGDFWFTRALTDGHVFLTLCDVSGKGVAASLVVSMVWGMLVMYDFGKGLADLLTGLNESLVATFRHERYLTGFFALYDPTTREIAVADMGHSHSLLFRKGRVMRLKGTGNIPVGIERVVDPVIDRWRLEPGDRLLVYSDGLSEQEDAAGEEFGEGRIASIAGACFARGRSLRHDLPEALDRHRGRIPQQDDMSFLCLSLAQGC
jgi:sigma-B regulation protein RsbU (phosphoserine phosphatase)